jgi:hypothetical protein
MEWLAAALVFIFVGHTIGLGRTVGIIVDNMRAFIAIAALASVVLNSPVSAQVCAGCGCKGGPGYRAPNGRCVGWADIDRTCGKPPTLRCSAELAPTDPTRHGPTPSDLNNRGPAR